MEQQLTILHTRLTALARSAEQLVTDPEEGFYWAGERDGLYKALQEVEALQATTADTLPASTTLEDSVPVTSEPAWHDWHVDPATKGVEATNNSNPTKSWSTFANHMVQTQQLWQPILEKLTNEPVADSNVAAEQPSQSTVEATSSAKWKNTAKAIKSDQPNQPEDGSWPSQAWYDQTNQANQSTVEAGSDQDTRIAALLWWSGLTATAQRQLIGGYDPNPERVSYSSILNYYNNRIERN